MKPGWFNSQDFKAAALEVFAFLEEAGFRHVSALDVTGPVWGHVVYMGRHLAFSVSCDIPDQDVTLSVIKLRDGAIPTYGSEQVGRNLYAFLERHHRLGQWNRVAESQRGKKVNNLRRTLGWWQRLLRGPGSYLLEDQPDSLP